MRHLSEFDKTDIMEKYLFLPMCLLFTVTLGQRKDRTSGGESRERSREEFEGRKYMNKIILLQLYLYNNNN